MAREDTTVIARTVVRIVVPLIFVTAVALLLQGHNRPGGGFIAGVLTTAGVALIYVVYGLDYLETELLHRSITGGEGPGGVGRAYVGLLAVGLALAAVGGLAAVAFGQPFLTQAVVVLHDVALFGEFELASALVFDQGVYGVVVGALLTVLAVVGSE
jgi:multicomponent Na+:H+ antiporter subunit B